MVGEDSRSRRTDSIESPACCGNFNWHPCDYAAQGSRFPVPSDYHSFEQKPFDGQVMGLYSHCELK